MRSPYVDTSGAGLGKDLVLNPPGSSRATSTSPVAAPAGERASSAAGTEKLQGKFYAHQNTDKDLVVCEAPRKLSGPGGGAAPAGPKRLSGPADAGAAPTTSGRTLASRTDVVVCEPPRRIGGSAPAADAAAPRKLSS